MRRLLPRRTPDAAELVLKSGGRKCRKDTEKYLACCTLCMSVLYQAGKSANFPMKSTTYRDVERVKGIEPSYEAWEAAVLPLNYTRDS